MNGIWKGILASVESSLMALMLLKWRMSPNWTLCQACHKALLTMECTLLWQSVH
jgi:hypothetical protein